MCGEERFEKRIYMTRSRNKFQNKLGKKGKKIFFGKTVCLCCAFMMKAGVGGGEYSCQQTLISPNFSSSSSSSSSLFPANCPLHLLLFRRDPFSPSSFSLLLCLPPFPCGFWFCETQERIDYFAKVHCLKGL